MQNEKYRLLLVEDDRELASMVADFLTAHEFDVTVEANGKTAVTSITAGNYDIVLLDIGLPGLDGISICRSVRSEFNGPIMILTARGGEVDEVTALEVGADDYVAKPVRPHALLARIKMHLRRFDPPVSGETLTRMEVGNILIDSENRTVRLDGQPVNLTTAEFDLLWLLAANAGKVVGRDQMYLELVGLPYDGLDRSIDLRVSRLRKKIGDDPNDPQRIKSVRAVGYLLAVEKR
jgi:DNA-binding response OmpR family regulator